MAPNTSPMICPRCGHEMNHHAEKLIHPTGSDDGSPDPVLGGIVEDMHACPACGTGASRRSVS
jgi:ribosomal protein S27AE